MARSTAALPLQIALFARQPPPQPPRVHQESTVHSTELWAALYFPRFALEVLAEEVVGGEVDSAAWVVSREVQGRPQVEAASLPAQQAGVAPGMALTAAYALCPELVVAPGDEAAEDACLSALADWAGQYTSVVSPDERALLLEVGGSLNLFGGLEALLARLRQDLRQHPAYQAHDVLLAVAPTVQAALLLARCGVERSVPDAAALRAALGELPLEALPVTEKQQLLFRRLGLISLRDLWRLPGAGLKRRFGTEFGDYLARLLGHKAEPRRRHSGAPVFSAAWSFPLETDNLTFIFHAVEQLLPGLLRFMQLRDLALAALRLRFYYNGRAADTFELRMRQPCRDMAHIPALLHERLTQACLSAPLIELELQADDFHAFVYGTAPLSEKMGEEGDDDPEWCRMLDRLHNRLGAAEVTALAIRDDHRPEYAWCDAPVGAVLEKALRSDKPRPLWLLPEPQRLGSRLSSIELLSEAERIESGWWDGRDIRRDYYRARDASGRRLWLFYDLRQHDWYLHGLFG